MLVFRYNLHFALVKIDFVSTNSIDLWYSAKKTSIVLYPHLRIGYGQITIYYRYLGRITQHYKLAEEV